MSDRAYRDAYPRAAKGGPGHAVVDCAVGTAGEPVDCKVARETPEGVGFGEAALKLSRFFRFRQPCPGERDRVTIPISFTPPR